MSASTPIATEQRTTTISLVSSTSTSSTPPTASSNAKSKSIYKFKHNFLRALCIRSNPPSPPIHTKVKPTPSTSTSSSALPVSAPNAVADEKTTVVITTATVCSESPPKSVAKAVPPQPAIMESVFSDAKRDTWSSASITNSGTGHSKSTDPTSKEPSPLPENSKNTPVVAEKLKNAAKTDKATPITKSSNPKSKSKSKTKSALPTTTVSSEKQPSPIHERGLLVPAWWTPIEGSKYKATKKSASNTTTLSKSRTPRRKQRLRPPPVVYPDAVNTSLPQKPRANSTEEDAANADLHAYRRACPPKRTSSIPAALKVRAEREMQMAWKAAAEGRERGGMVKLEAESEAEKEGNLTRRGGNEVMFSGATVAPGFTSSGQWKGKGIDRTIHPNPSQLQAFPPFQAHTHLHRAVDKGNIFGGTKLDRENTVVVRLAPMEWYIKPRYPYETEALFWESVRSDLEWRRREGDVRAKRWGAGGLEGAGRRRGRDIGGQRKTRISSGGGPAAVMDTIAEEEEGPVGRRKSL